MASARVCASRRWDTASAAAPYPALTRARGTTTTELPTTLAWSVVASARLSSLLLVPGAVASAVACARWWAFGRPETASAATPALVLERAWVPSLSQTASAASSVLVLVPPLSETASAERSVPVSGRE